VNYFTKADPFVSVGSVMKAGSPAEYQWRWYDAVRTISGIAADMQSAEQRIKSQYRNTTGRFPDVIDADEAGRMH
jgi:hypothetical protein